MLNLVDLETTQLLSSLSTHQASLNQLLQFAVSRSSPLYSSWLFSASSDNTVLGWDLRQMATIMNLPHADHVLHMA